MKLFVDASAFIALHDRNDQYHLVAKKFYETLTAKDKLLTSNYVIDETITRLRYAIGPEAAVQFAEALWESGLFEILYVDAEIERQSLKILKKYKDKKLSFTDCSTMAIGTTEKIDAIFAFDDDFIAAGRRVMPYESKSR